MAEGDSDDNVNPEETAGRPDGRRVAFNGLEDAQRRPVEPTDPREAIARLRDGVGPTDGAVVDADYWEVDDDRLPGPYDDVFEADGTLREPHDLDDLLRRLEGRSVPRASPPDWR